MDDAEQLREDIQTLRALIDTMLDDNGGRIVLKALADVLHGRLERLEALETGHALSD